MALTKLQAAVIEGVLGLTWQSPAKTSSFAAAIGNGYYLNTTTGAITVTLPSSPTVGDSVGIIDYAGTAASNTITLTSSNNIQGSSDDKIVNYTRGALRITYADTTQGWVASAAANDGTSALNPIPPILVDFLVVAGGGGGGAASGGGGGGGGAGGLLTNFGATAFNAFTGTAYDIEVGTTGTGATTGANAGTSGGNSKFTSSYISLGGGGGSGYGVSGLIGGSGGGGAGNTVSSPGIAGTAGQGTSGGNGGGDGTTGGGGGGGKDGSGTNATSTSGGNGGASLEVNIIGGTGNYYAGGGGGGLDSRTNGSVGTGGTSSGGNGGGSSTGNQATTGVINTGGGGGGDGYPTSSYPAKNGGSGIVILRYPTADVSSYAVTGTLDTLSNASFPTTNQGLYQFNGNINDSSGNGNNISVTGSVSYTTGLYGQCAVLGSSTTSLNTGISGALAQTWSVWVKMPASLGSGYRIVNSLNNSGDAGQYINYNSSNELRIGDILGGASSSGVTVITDLGTEWHNIVNVNNTTQSLMYLDGSLIATNTAASGNLQTGNSIYFGRGPYGTAINGMNIDQSRIINSALSASDVVKLYNEGQIIETTDGSNSILQFKGGTGTITFS